MGPGWMPSAADRVGLEATRLKYKLAIWREPIARIKSPYAKGSICIAVTSAGKGGWLKEISLANFTRGSWLTLSTRPFAIFRCQPNDEESPNQPRQAKTG